jgi:energy-coupling factor transporter ATP-binding protein EcfA2
MNEVKISFKNYKLLKEGEINLHEGSIFFIQGPNNRGKSSMLNLLQSIMEVKDDTINPVYNPLLDPNATNFDKVNEGFSTGTIPGADGLIYQYRYDFNIDGKTKFQFIAPDGKVVKSITEMRAIFNYTHFTLEEFFEWSKTEPGRKKQREIFMGLLKEKERNDILEIDEKVHPTKGTLIDSRKEVNKDVDFLTKKINAVIFTPNQQNLIANKTQIIKLFDELTEQKEKCEKIIAGFDTYEVKLKAEKDKIDPLKESYDKQVTTLEKSIKDTEDEIEKLQKKLKEDKESLKLENETYQTSISIINDAIKKLNEDYDINIYNNNKLLLDGDGTEKNPGILARLKIGENKKDELTKLEVLVNQKKEDEEKLIKSTKESEDYDTKIEILRNKKKSIIQNSENIPLGWSLNDDYLTIDNVPFMETDLSKSQATKAIAELMIRINKCPIMLMGDAESLGYEILDELDAYAKEQGKIMIFAEHIRSKETLELVCYDEIDHVSKTTKKDLF